MSDLVNAALSVAMAVLPVIGYIDQYRIIRKAKTSLGFNVMTCGVLLFANILRIFFWFGKRFDVTLLFQSIIMILAILLLLEIVIRYKPLNVPFAPLIRHNSSDSYSSTSSSSQRIAAVEETLELKWYQRTFWDWDHFLDYVNCLLGYTTIVGILYIFFHEKSWFIEGLGFLSLGIESTLPLPQCLTNFKHRNTDGFSILILGSWFIGDGFKAFYFFYTHAPIQFVVCALIQLSFDTIIVVQFIIFSKPIKKLFGFGQEIPYEPIA